MTRNQICVKNYDSSKIKPETLSCFYNKEQKSNLRKTREGLKMKKNEKKKEKSNLKGQKST